MFTHFIQVLCVGACWCVLTMPIEMRIIKNKDYLIHSLIYIFMDVGLFIYVFVWPKYSSKLLDRFARGS